MSTKLLLACAFAAAVATPMIGCPGELDDPSRFSGDSAVSTNCDAPSVVFAGTCATAGCHTKADAPSSGDLDLQSPDIVGRLKNKKSKGGAPLLINSTAPEQSSLYTKLKAPPPFGSKMPLGGTLPADKVECVLTWLKKEAPGGTTADTGTSSDTGGGTDTGGATDAAADGG